MAGAHSPLSSEELVFKEVKGLSGSIKCCVFHHSTTSDDENIPMGGSRPWKLVNPSIGGIELYQGINRPPFFVQPTEIERQIGEPSDTNTHLIYLTGDTMQRELINDQMELQTIETTTYSFVHRIKRRSISFKEIYQAVNDTLIHGDRRHRNTIA